MKKIISYLVVFALMATMYMPAMASGEKVEISFCIGDETLIINGSPVTVEKPYVVGEGVTLVPIRVITEAFNAKVDWIDETKTVKLTYPDVNIVIQIDNPVAEVNGRAETLLAAPQLTPNGYTMVPLRFISENFGADVSYDDDTKRITVTKEIAGDQTVSIEGAVNTGYIGDSFFKWTMENPKDMTMDYRSFDGMETTFSDGENVIEIGIFIYDKEDYDFESDYNEIKMAMSDLTLVKTEKNTNDKNCKSFHLGVKDKNCYYDYQQFVTPDYIYTVSGMLSNETPSVRDQYLNLLSTFVCKFENNDTYDLSNIKDGYKRYESEHLKLSFDVPQNFYMATSEDSQNRFEFYDIEKGISSITAVVYSKSDVESAASLASVDYNHNKKVLNEKIATFSNAPVQRQYSNICATEYSYTVKEEKKKYHIRDIFFEVGEYVYNVSVGVELSQKDYDKYIDRIIESIKAEELDTEEIGILMRNIPVATGTTKAKLGKLNMDLPNIYMKLASDDETMSYMGSVNGVMVSCFKVATTDLTVYELKKMMKESETGMKNEGADILKSVYEKAVNNHSFQTFQAKYTEEEQSFYYEQYACLYKGTVYGIIISCSELTYSEDARMEISGIIDSIKFE